MRAVLHHIALISEIGPIAVKQIREAIGRGVCQWDDLYRCTATDLEQLGLSARGSALLHAGLADYTALEREQRLLERQNISLIALTDETYPAFLAAIHAPPPVLYVRGSVAALTAAPLVALVGSRDMSPYGNEVVRALVEAIVPAGWAVVSGGARGIDAAAHQATLRATGITVAVLGSGLLRSYPREHHALFDAIAAEQGAVVSTYPLEATARPGYFPARNRVIAGLAHGCIVVQAAEKSGALLTARCALDEGRELGAVPGSIFDPRSAGCHRLLREGAVPITSGQSALAMLGVTSVSGAQPVRTVVDPIVELCGTGASFDLLLGVTGYSADQLQMRLWELQIGGKIEQTMHGSWRVVS